MNGLRYIRKQCNFSLSQLAERLEVSRQIISAWENGKKEIPEMRKKQLADFFGIDKCFFDEISEEQKRILLDKAMFRYIEDGEETYRYKPDKNTKKLVAYFPPEHEMSLSEELIELQRKQKQLLDRINHMISGPKQVSLRDQMCFITRGVEVFSMIADAMDGCFSKEIQYKMPYYFGILEVLRAMNIVINLSDDEHRDNVSDDENFNELVSVIKRVFENMMDKTSIPVNNSEKNNGNNKEVLTMQEKIHMAEESYSKFEKPKDMKMYSVYLMATVRWIAVRGCLLKKCFARVRRA